MDIEGLDVGSTNLVKASTTNIPWAVPLPSTSESHEGLDWNRPKHVSCHPGGHALHPGKEGNPKNIQPSLYGFRSI